MKNMFNPHLWNLIKINWSIAWRANVLALTTTIIFFGLFSIVIAFYTETDNIDFFREHIFVFFPFFGNESVIAHPTFLMRIYVNIWTFICNYCLYFYGFKRILKLNLYPVFLQNTMTLKNYNNVFLIPHAIYSFTDPNYLNTSNYIGPMTLYLIINLLYYYILFTNLRKLITHQ